MRTSNAQPFPIDPLLLCLRPWETKPEDLLSLTGLRDPRALEDFVRLWLTEGTPVAFADSAAAYEFSRRWLADELGVCPKSITLVGSARLNYSLRPKTYARAFNDESDLDLAIVSEPLFDGFRKAFELWREDYKGGVAAPSNETERKYWNENRDVGARTLSRGFFDSILVPNRDRYAVAKRVNDTRFRLTKRLLATQGAPRFKKATVRVYRDWRSLVAQVTLNLRRALKELSDR